MSLTVSDQILAEIGRVTVLQSHIEAQIALFIRELLFLDEAKGNIITSRLRIGELIDALRSLLVSKLGHGNSHVTRFERFSKELDKCRRQRNEIVHSLWSFGDDLKADSATRSKVKKNKREFVPIKLDDLQKLSKEMEQLEWEAGDMRVKVCHNEANTRLQTF